MTQPSGRTIGPPLVEAGSLRGRAERLGLRPSRTLILLAVCLATGGRTTAAAGAAPQDPLRGLLAMDDYEAARSGLERQIRDSDQPPCARLAAFSTDRSPQVREHAVRALADIGCGDFASYRPYASDQSPWVMRALFAAVERYRTTQAVPFLIDSLTDARMILSDEGSFTLGSLAHRALRAVTCQSFHFDPAGSVQGQADAVTQWRSWYAAHRNEPREAWVADGIALAKDYIARDFAPHRREGVDLLVLIGPPAVPALRDVLARSSQDLRATVTCNPDEPPRVTDQVPCILMVENASRRRLLLAPADVDLRIARIDRERAPVAGRGAAPDRLSGADRTGDANRAPGGTRAGAPPPSDFAVRVVDLAPGEILRRDFKVGPVGGAGRYEVRAILPDLGSSLQAPDQRTPSGRSAGASTGPKGAPLPSIEATTIVRFEQ